MPTTAPTPSSHPVLALAPQLPMVGLATIPTPVRTVNIEGQPVFVKDDGESGEHYGGNKVRKLEMLFGHALANGFDSVWTIGAVGSNHVLATSVYARLLGLRCRALHFGQPPTDHVRANLRAVATQGTDLTLVSRTGLPAAIAHAWLHAALVERAYTIPGGGSSSVGAIGYVNAGLELARQIEQGALAVPDRVYVAAGTGGTLAGLAVGLGLAGLDTHVVGVGVTEPFVCNHATIHALIAGVRVAMRRHGYRGPWRTSRWSLSWEHLGDAYGVPTAAGTEAIQLAGTGEVRLKLEPTYTGKTFAALVDAGRRGAHQGQTILYWHTLNARSVEALTDPDLDTSALPSGYAPWL